MNNSAIGVYDSGFGGLSVWGELYRALPDESLTYLGDGKNCPYGGRTREQITGFAREAVRRLVDEGCKMIVVACNTATAAAVDTLRREWPPPPNVRSTYTPSGRIESCSTASSSKTGMWYVSDIRPRFYDK